MSKLDCVTSLDLKTGQHTISVYEGEQLIVGAAGSKIDNKQSPIAAVALNYAIEEIELLRAELARYQSTEVSAEPGEVIVVEKTQFESKLQSMLDTLDKVDEVA